MKYFAAVQSILDADKVEAARPAHLAYLDRVMADGRIHLRGRFPDGSGGLTIYRAESLDEARSLAENDPFIASGARKVELHEWDMKPRPRMIRLPSTMRSGRA
jgi:uncharacterized protein YciI